MNYSPVTPGQADGGADASADDHLVTNTDATPGPEDGDQSIVSQEPIGEDEVDYSPAGAS